MSLLHIFIYCYKHRTKTAQESRQIGAQSNKKRLTLPLMLQNPSCKGGFI